MATATIERETSTVSRIAVRIPSDADFAVNEDDFLRAQNLEAIGDALIGRYPELAHLREHDARIAFLWKRKGGKTKGNATFGKCQKPSGLLAHFSGQDFVVWVAADHTRDRGFSPREFEALLFHELLHTGWEAGDEESDEEGHWTTEGHDVEAFTAEIRHFGLWQQDLQTMGDAVRQLRLDEAA